MKRKYIVCLLAILIIPGLFTQGFAFVEWNIHKTLKLETQPLDVAVSNNGNSIFVHQFGKDTNLFVRRQTKR